MAESVFVSRAGEKLAAALDRFGVDVTGMVCADLGCNVGGFTDCLLQRGAERVYAVDTGYGALAWKLRQDERVVVMERTNALHLDPPEEGVGLVTVDLSWTPQRYGVPAALRWRPGRVITLIKPHYEASAMERAGERLPEAERRLEDASEEGEWSPPAEQLREEASRERQEAERRGRSKKKGKRGGGAVSKGRGVLEEAEAERVVRYVLGRMPAWGGRVVDWMRSPVIGGAGKKRGGNVEYLALLEPGEPEERGEPGSVA